ncbi:MAG: hypothetical protein RIF33_11915 [Cyclobacteriaceae bacterium]
MTKLEIILDEYWNLKDEVFYPFDWDDKDYKPGVNEWQREAHFENKQRLEFLKGRLKKVPEEGLMAYKEVFLNQLKLLSALLEKSKNGRKISRHQALAIDNAVYARIIMGIKSTLRFANPSVPDLYRTNIEEDMLDVDPLIDILRNFQRELKSIKNFDFFDLEMIADNLIGAINKQWQEDNKTLKQLQRA